MKKFLLSVMTISLIVASILLTSFFAVGCKDKEKEYGEFYSLQEAYDNGFLTVEDLKSIAYYQFNGTKNNEEIMGENFEPKPKGELNKKTEKKIKSTMAYVYQNREEHSIEASASDFSVEEYYGSYNGCFVIGIEYISAYYPDVVVPPEYYKVEGVTFVSVYTGPSLFVWREK